MPPLFDLKKYLEEVSHLQGDDLRRTVVDGENAGAGMEEYIRDIHQMGADILSQHIQEEELDHLIAMVAGISTSQVIHSPDVPMDDKLRMHSLNRSHPEFVRILTLSVMCAAMGLCIKEEWR